MFTGSRWQCEISVQDGAKFSAGGRERGGGIAVHAYSWIRHWAVTSALTESEKAGSENP